MPGPMVCGVDDSAGSREAVAAAMAISARIELQLLFVHVAPDQPWQFGHDPGRKHRLGESVSIGIALLERMVPRSARVRGAISRVPLGDPAHQLAAVAASSGAEMVVVGCRGRGAVKAALLGSVSRALIRLCVCPVLVVPPGARIPHSRRESGRSHSVLCGIDGSTESLHAARVASHMAAQLGDRLLLVHAYRAMRTSLARRYESGPLRSEWKAAPTLLSTVSHSLRHPDGPESELTIEPGDPREALIRTANREDAELLVLGSPGHGPGAPRSDGLVATSPIPVLVVPSPSEAGAGEGEQDADVKLAPAASRPLAA